MNITVDYVTVYYTEHYSRILYIKLNILKFKISIVKMNMQKCFTYYI